MKTHQSGNWGQKNRFPAVFKRNTSVRIFTFASPCTVFVVSWSVINLLTMPSTAHSIISVIYFFHLCQFINLIIMLYIKHQNFWLIADKFHVLASVNLSYLNISHVLAQLYGQWPVLQKNKGQIYHQRLPKPAGFCWGDVFLLNTAPDAVYCYYQDHSITITTTPCADWKCYVRLVRRIR